MLKTRHYLFPILALAALAGLPSCPPNAFHSLTLAVSPSGSGMVVADPAQPIYFAGAEVELTAVPADGWHFSHWIGDGINTSTRVTHIAVYQDETVTAVFEPENAPEELTIMTPTDLPDGEVGTLYDLSFVAAGGASPYLWSVESELLSVPLGVSLSSGGQLRGVPLVYGQYTFSVGVVDSLGDTVAKNFSLTILNENLVEDPGFEAGREAAFWTQASDLFGSPICDTTSCDTVNGIGPHTGTHWVYFGGAPNGEAEAASVEQTIDMPAVGVATLRFYLAIPVAEAVCRLEVSLGGNVLFEVTDADQADYAAYQLVTLDASLYADGGAYALRFDYYNEESAGAATAVFVDDVALVAGGA